MKQLKKIFLVLTVLLLVSAVLPQSPDSAFLLTAQAHSGRTDAYGGHHDYKNVSGLGYYHYHCGGYPAHLHPNGVCPYSSSAGKTTTGKTTTGNVKINKKSATIKETQTLQLKITGSTQSVKWSSSKKSVATVSSTGKVTARNAGKATITARVGGKKYTCKITVKALLLNKTDISLTEGQSTVLKLNIKSKIKWSSSDKKVAKVNSKGKVTAVGEGQATITAKVGKKKCTCSVTVLKGLSPLKSATEPQ